MSLDNKQITVAEVLHLAGCVISDVRDRSFDETRMQILANWILLNLNKENLKEEYCGGIAKITTSDMRTAQCAGSQAGTWLPTQRSSKDWQPPMSIQTVRELATALFLCAEHMEYGQYNQVPISVSK
jgi:hypothetical protein